MADLAVHLTELRNREGAAWLTPPELRRVVDAVANDLYATRDGDKNDAGLRERYPVQA